MSQKYSRLAFVLSLMGGLIILIGGIISSMWFLYGGSVWRGTCSGMMGGYHGMMGSFGFPYGFMGGLSLVGLVSGIIIVIAAAMLDIRPQERQAWGVIVIIFSVISFLNMAGFLIGGILALIGGAFALSSKKE
ncbi:MAG: DUF6114 domain-containing protein [Thermoproteota archaeon]